jgi:hypothetical protein
MHDNSDALMSERVMVSMTKVNFSKDLKKFPSSFMSNM